MFWGSPMPDSLDNLLLGAITICTGLAGFLIASMAILFSIEEKYIIQQLRNNRLYNQLIASFVYAIRWSLGSLLVSMAGLFANFEMPYNLSSFFFVAWLFVFVNAICTCYAVIDLLSKSLTAKKE